MPFQLSPGVNITETDLTTIVPAVATTSAGIAIRSNWGPAHERILVDSPKNLRALYGDPDNRNAAFWFSAANYLAYGSALQVVRVVKPSVAANAGPASTKPYIPNTKTDVTTKDPATEGPFAARWPGSRGNSLQVEVCGAGTTSEFEGWAYKNYFNNEPTTSDTLKSLGGTGDELHVVVVDVDGKFAGQTGQVIESYDSLSLSPQAKEANGKSLFYKHRLRDESRYVWALGNDSELGLNVHMSTPVSDSFGSIPDADTRLDFTTVNGGVAKWKFEGGTGEDTGAMISSDGGLDYGFDLFRDSESVDVSLLIGGPLTAAAAVALKDLAKDRKDCIAFLSPETYTQSTEADKLAEAFNFRNLVGSSSYAVIDSGYKYQYDAYNDVYRYIPLNGDIAGLCARTDSQFDPWWSPAGLNRGQVRGVVKLGYNPTKSHRDELYRRGINPVVTFPGEGTVLFGDKTALTRPSAFDRINVRRLFIVLEKAIATASKFQLFEFNDAFTRNQFKSLVEPFLRDVQSRRGVQDFKVVCDETNNTGSVIDRNEFVADIYVKPNRSINYIQLNFIATRTGVSFEEVGA